MQAIWKDHSKQEDRTDRLAAIERRLTEQHSEPVDLSRLITAAARLAADQRQGKMLLQLPEGVFVQGPADDVRELIVGLIEHAGTGGYDKVKFRAQVNYMIDCSRLSCTAEIVTPTPDVPDFLRRELWEVVGKRRGQVSITSETGGCRIEFTLPLERRLGTILG